MTIDLDIENILTKEEIKDIATSVFTDQIKRIYCGDEQNLQRLITNLSYEFVFKMIDEVFDGNLEKILRAKVKEIIEGLTSYAVFQKESDYYRDKDSIATKIMNEEVLNSRELIKSRVESVINEYEFNYVKNNIHEYIFECIKDNLSRKDGEKVEY